MATMIPDTMPEDWFIEGAAARGCEPDDPDLKRIMMEAYGMGLDHFGVAGIKAKLKDMCIAAAEQAERNKAV